MADTNERPSLRVISVSSHDTALCVIPPECGYIDGLRELYDKAYGLWPPHINLVYPFVKPTSLPQAHQRIKSYFDEHLNPSDPRTVSMDEAGVFRNRKTDTIFLREGQDSSSSHLSNLRSMALEALGQTPTASTLHLTVGQPEDKTLDSRDFLLAKAQLLPALNFRIGALAILLCERLPGSDAHHMRLWGTIDVTHSEDAWQPHSQEYWIRQPIQALHPHSSKSGEDSTNADTPGYTRNVKLGITHQYSSDQDIWIACTGSDDMNSQNTCAISIASYNVLVESDFPPARDRDVLLARTILSDSAMADILVLQEVSDDFLSSLLGDPEVQRRYPFASHAPPSQENIGPLFSLRNIVILSRWRFNWESLPLNRRHKSAMVAKFEGIFQSNSSRFIVAGVHLTSGLTDGSVAAKKAQLEALTTYLTESYGSEPWAIAGDFNIPTSEYTIETAQKNNSITIPTKVALKSMEASLVMLGLLDTWAVARVEAADGTGMSMDDDLLEGEDGCTFDPRNNMLAAGSVITSENRPQRYDRVLVNPRDKLQITGFKIFGHTEDVDGIQVVASDHSGVRASMSVLDGQQKSADHSSIAAPSPVEYRRAVELLSESSDLKLVLEAHRMFPTSSEVEQRRHAFTLLKQAVLGLAVDNNLASADTPLVVVAVGSYALGVWTSDSDIGCLCIGTISSKTFFKLVRQRLLKAENQGVRILRKVEANSGTMLELSINGVATDLQYCPAAQVVERWSEFRVLPPSDPIFNLQIMSLSKLKPYRDLLYTLRTLPSLPTFRLAYRCIKLWAIQHGVYSTKFGFLGGVHITLMLSAIYKRIANGFGAVSAGDLITSFFHHYAHFEWANEMVYDSFFHKNVPRYHRSAREPMVVLGFHTPNSNIAHTSTVPGVQVLVKEFSTADARLSDPAVTWETFFRPFGGAASTCELTAGAASFLDTHESYAKIDINYWGRSLAKGKSLVGWLESRALSLVIDLHKTLPNLEIRIWPALFTDNDYSETTDYHGCYLIGLSREAADISSASKDRRYATKQSLYKVFDRFLERVKTDDRYYDPESCWIAISLAKASDLKGYRLDDREWGDYAAEMNSDSDEEEDVSTAPIQRTIPHRPKPTPKPVSTSKLRPASDVLNRLRWDPNLDPADYIIGYEDRFLGARETSLEKWKTEQTDEEFIPQHRILYFKKRSGNDGKGEVMWERMTRIDRIFGSGAGAGGEELLDH